MDQMTIPQAAIRLGISEKSVRRRLASGKLEGRQQPSPGGYRWTVSLPAQDTPAGTAEPLGAPWERLVAILEGEVSELRQQIQAKDQQILQLHQLLGAKALERGQGKKWWTPWRR